MAFQTLRTEITDHVLTLTLSRPDRLNAFTTQMQHELIAAFDEIDANDDVRAVIVTGEGRGFCAGADLGSGGNTFDASGQERLEDHRDGGGQVTLRIFESKKPIIAAINGPAVGVGITMTLPDGCPSCEPEREGGVCLRAPRNRPRSRIELVPAAHRRHQPGDGVGGDGANLLRRGGARRAALSPGSCPRPSYCPQLARSPERSRTTQVQCRSHSRGRCSGACSERITPTPRTSSTRKRSSRWDGRRMLTRAYKAFLEKRPPQFKLRVSKDMPVFYPWWKDPRSRG